MFLLSFPRNAWQSGASVYIKSIFSMVKGTKMFLQPSGLCHQASSAYHLIVPQCNDAGEMIDDQIAQRRQVQGKYFLDVIKCLRYLVREGISFQGLDNNDNLTQILYLLGTKDYNITKHLHQTSFRRGLTQVHAS